MEQDEGRGRYSIHDAEPSFGNGVKKPQPHLPNGISKLANGIHESDNSPQMAANLSTPPAVQHNRLPDEIEHIVQNFQPLSKLINRTAQTTFEELTHLIDEMSEMPVSYATNGNAGATANVNKKVRLLEFAQEKRAEFIKILVLSKWSRGARDVSKVIDIKLFLDKQRMLYDEALFWIAHIKAGLADAKVPNPDIPIAVEVLSSGDVAGFPNLNYIKTDELDTPEILKALQHMNSLLHIRLYLHEWDHIPEHLRQFSIKDGRVTFKITGEFEIDLSIADEDLSSQYYFIDFRFLFTPSTITFPAGRIRNEIEMRVNDILKREGLSRCYDFLHGLVLTQKLNILRKQGRDMLRGPWSGSLRVELVRRTLIVQYWLHRPGKKSWIEIAVNSGRRQGKGIPVSYLQLQWYREGKKVVDEPMEFETINLSLDRTMDRIVALHTSHILRSIAKKLKQTPIYSKGRLPLDGAISQTEGAESYVQLGLTGSRDVKFTVEPTSGRLVFTPIWPQVVPVEQRVNSLLDVAQDAFNLISQMRRTVSQEEVKACALSIGWNQLDTWSPPNIDEKKRFFGKDDCRLSLFRGSKYFHKDWLIAHTASMTEDKFWLVNLKDNGTQLPIKPKFSIAAATWVSRFEISHVHHIPTGTKHHGAEITYEFLRRLEIVAGAMISFLSICDEFMSRNKKFTLRPQPHPNPRMEIPVLFVEFPKEQVPPKSTSKPQMPALRWIHNNMKIEFIGLSGPPLQSQDNTFQVHMVAHGKLLEAIPNIHKLQSKTAEGLVFKPDTGHFAIRIGLALGANIIPILLDRLDRLARLMDFFNVIRQKKLVPVQIAFSRLVFQYGYGKNDRYLATVDLPNAEKMNLKFDEGNPHLRIRDYLVQDLNNGDKGLERVAMLLVNTLSIMHAFDDLERDDCRVSVIPRSSEWFQVTFFAGDSTHPTSYIFNIQMNIRRGDIIWEVTGAGSLAKILSLTGSQQHQENGETQHLSPTQEKVKQLFSKKEKGQSVLGTQVACQGKDLVKFLRRLKDTVCSGNDEDDQEPIDVDRMQIDKPAMKEAGQGNMRTQGRRNSNAGPVTATMTMVPTTTTTQLGRGIGGGGSGRSGGREVIFID
ncbi:MAG: mediator complex subunit [Cirrosporium novae-zelandiae]|nr:MAG: mediator complex subunit [Cirrosporium novae-zelandiae]